MEYYNIKIGNTLDLMDFGEEKLVDEHKES